MYIRTGNVHSVPIKSNEIDQILQKRNDFVGQVRHPFSDKETLTLRPLPALVNYSSRICTTCFKRDICAFWSKVEGIEPADKTVQEAFDNDTLHIDQPTQDYIVKWTKLGLLEQAEEEKKSRGHELWNSESSLTINNVKLEKKQVKQGAKIGIIATLPFGTDWTLGSIDTHNKERVSISTNSKVAVAFGYAKRIIKPKLMSCPTKVELLVDRYLDPDEIYRIDSANNVGGGSFGAKLWLGNVWCFSSPNYTKLRQLITGQIKPSTYRIVTQAVGHENRQLIIDVIKSTELNVEQKKAVQLGLTIEHFALIQGFPGTGKSKVISVLCEILIRCGKRVILSAHTHNAVDNVMEGVLKRLSPKLQKRCVRLGSTDKMDINIRQFSEDVYFHNIKTGDDYDAKCNKSLLIAGTCMGLGKGF